MKYFEGGTKMFLGMSIARQVMRNEKVPGRSQLVIFVTDGVDSFPANLLEQAEELKKDGVRIVTIAAGAFLFCFSSCRPESTG
jgi:Mg-chelatase subunit ChlD